MLRGKVKTFFSIDGGNSGLNEFFTYNNQPKSNINSVRIYSSSTQENTSLKNIDRYSLVKKGKKEIPIKKYSGEGILVARNGKAGKMIYVNEESFTMNDHAYIIKVKPKYKNEINIKYLLYSQKQTIEKCVISEKKGNRTFSKILFEEQYISIPDLDEQNKIVEEYNKIIQIKEQLDKIIFKINGRINHQLTHISGDEVPLSDVFLLYQGHQITDEELYNTEGDIPVFTADNTIKGFWNKSYITENELPCLTYATKGFTGKITIQSKLFDANNTAVLCIRDKYKDRIDLRYFKYILSSIFSDATSSKNGISYLNKEFVNKIVIIVPKYEYQVKIADEYEKLEKIKERLECISNKCKSIID